MSAGGESHASRAETQNDRASGTPRRIHRARTAGRHGRRTHRAARSARARNGMLYLRTGLSRLAPALATDDGRLGANRERDSRGERFVGTLTTPAAGDIYTDTQTLIYTVQRHPVYAPLCRPLWQAATTGQNRVFSSDLALMETLVMPLRNADTVLQGQFEHFLLHSDVTLLPITQSVLREAARLRASIPALK